MNVWYNWSDQLAPQNFYPSCRPSRTCSQGRVIGCCQSIGSTHTIIIPNYCSSFPTSLSHLGKEATAGPGPYGNFLPSLFLHYFLLRNHSRSTISPKSPILPILHTRDSTITSAKMPENPAMNGGNFTHNNTTAPEYTDRVLPLFSLKGRTAIVSGAGAGIGLAVAHALAEAGANVAIWYNSNKKAIVEAEKIEKTFGVKCKSIP